MKKDFICPECTGQLFVNDRIIFSTKTDSGKAGLILLSPELGDYKVVKHESYKINEGEHVDFYCPICHANLIVEKGNHKFTRVMMVEMGEEYEVLFSQIAGEKCTYVIGEGSVKAFGEDADEFTNFWGVSPKY